MDEEFWSAIEALAEKSEIVIDRPKGSTHPRFLDVSYPLDYGYLAGTRSGDQSGIDLWMGSLDEPRVSAIVCTIDLNKSDAEIKILLGCTKSEANQILAFHNQGGQSGILIKRDNPPLTES
jgi:inorganic pyrophosphatase